MNKKLNFEEILGILKNKFEKVDDFVYEKLDFNIEDYPKAVKAEKNRKDFMDIHYKNSKWDSDENYEIYSSLPSEYDIARELYKKDLGIEWEEVYQKGGEGLGDHWESVKYFKDHDIYISVTGFYSSYNGTDFSGWEDACTEVKLKEKLVTVYESI